MVILEHLCSISSSREIEKGINAECVVNFNKYTHHPSKFDGFYIWELSRFAKINRDNCLPEIQKKCISFGGEKIQFSLLSKSIPVNIIKISISNEWCQSKGISDIIQTSKFFLSPNKSLNLFSDYLDDKSRSLFEGWETYEMVNSAAFVSSIKRYIEVYCNELKEIRDPDANSSIIDFIIKNFVSEFDRPYARIGEICEFLNISERKFKHLFHKEIGVSFYQYCREKCMQQASEWLMSGELNVKNISAKFGYGHPKTFAHDFKSYFGRSPMQYVKYYR